MTDRKGRILVGMDTGQTEFNTLGKIGGAKTKQLSLAEVPSHVHSDPPFNFFVTKADTIYNSSPSGLGDANLGSEPAVGNWKLDNHTF